MESELSNEISVLICSWHHTKQKQRESWICLVLRMSISPLLFEETKGDEESLLLRQTTISSVIGVKRKRKEEEETGDGDDDEEQQQQPLSPPPFEEEHGVQDEQQQQPVAAEEEAPPQPVDEDNNNNSEINQQQQQDETEGKTERKRNKGSSKGKKKKKHKHRHDRSGAHAQAEWEQAQAEGGVGRADNLGGIDGPPPKTEEQLERDERIKQCIKRMKYGSEIDWKRVDEDDFAFATRIAAKFGIANLDNFAGDRSYCLPCRLRGKVEIGGHDPYQDLKTLVQRNYGRMGLETLLTIIQRKYVSDVLAWNKDPNADTGRFWYRATILEHIRHHSVNECVLLMDRLHQKSNLFELGLEFVCEYDPVSQQYDFNSKMMKPLKDIADCEMRIFGLLDKRGRLNQPI